MLVENINSKDFFERAIVLLSVSTIEEFNLKALPQLSKYFTLFIANNNEVNKSVYKNKANEIIKSGLAYLCTWGKECKKIHDIFDEEEVSLEIDNVVDPNDDNVIITTWHNDESFKEALWYFLKNTLPTEKYYSECNFSLVLVIGNSIKLEKIKFYLENQNLLDEE